MSSMINTIEDIKTKISDSEYMSLMEQLGKIDKLNVEKSYFIITYMHLTNKIVPPMKYDENDMNDEYDDIYRYPMVINKMEIEKIEYVPKNKEEMKKIEEIIEEVNNNKKYKLQGYLKEKLYEKTNIQCFKTSVEEEQGILIEKHECKFIKIEKLKLKF